MLWALAFLGALVLIMNGAIYYSIKTSQKLLDVELGKRLEGTARIAALLVHPEHAVALAAAVRDTAQADSIQTDFVLQMDAIEAQDRLRQDWTQLSEGAEASNIVLLDRDVRKAFPDDREINETLREVAKARRKASRAKKSPVRKTASRSRRAA